MKLSNSFGGGIKPIQRGSNSNSAAGIVNVTISEVNLAKAFVISSWRSGNTGASGVAASLTSSTNLKLNFGAGASGVAVEVEWQVVEYV